MTVHLAATRSDSTSPVTRALTLPTLNPKANDDSGRLMDDKGLQAALRHFSEHGLSSAEVAQDRAESAQNKGDAEEFAWWLEICRTFDKRRATRLEAQADSR